MTTLSKKNAFFCKKSNIYFERVFAAKRCDKATDPLDKRLSGLGTIR